MSSALKNRLVGTIIIVALAVIFLPDILDGQKQTQQDLFLSLPEQPLSQPIAEAPAFPSEQVMLETAVKTEIVPDVATDDFDMVDVSKDSSSTETQSINDADKRVDTAENEKSAQQIDRKIVDPATSTGNDVVNDDSSLTESGWVVQLGVFRHQKNVRDLLTTLRNAGYRAFSRPVQTNSGELTKVFVGPDLDKETLQKAIPHLRDLTKLQGRITPFTVK